MATQLQPLEKLQDYVAKAKDADYTLKIDGDEDYATRLCNTLHSLQNQVKQHEAALEKVGP